MIKSKARLRDIIKSAKTKKNSKIFLFKEREIKKRDNYTFTLITEGPCPSVCTCTCETPVVAIKISSVQTWIGQRFIYS